MRTSYKLIAILLIMTWLSACAAPTKPPAAPTVAPSQPPTAVAANTLAPTPAPTHTPQPPTATPLPTLTSTSLPSPTVTPSPTATLEPTATATLVPTPTTPPPGTLLARLGKGYFRSFAYSLDGQSLAVMSAAGIYIYSTATLAEQAFIPVTDVERLFYRSDGQLMASAWQPGTKAQPPILMIWPVAAAGLQPAVAQITGWVGTEEWDALLYQVSPDGERVAIFDPLNMHLEVWQISNASVLASWEVPPFGEQQAIGSSDPVFVFSPDSSMLVYCNGYAHGGNITALRLTGAALQPFFSLALIDKVPNYKLQNYWPSLGNYGIGLAISPDGAWLATGGPDSIVRVWELNSGELLSTLTEQSEKAVHVAFSPDGKILAAVNRGSLYLYTTQDWKLLAAQRNAVSTRPLALGGGEVLFSPDGAWAVAASGETIYFTDLATGIRARSLSGFAGPFRELAVSRDGAMLAMSGMGADELSGEKIYLYTLPELKLHKIISTDDGYVKHMAFSPQGEYLAVSMENQGEGCDGYGQVWRVADAAEIQRLELTPVENVYACVGALAYAPNGRWLAIGVDYQVTGSPSITQLWRVKNETYTLELELNLPGVGQYGAEWLEFSADSKNLVAYAQPQNPASADNGIAGYNLDTKEIDFTATGTVYGLRVAEAEQAGWNAALKWVALAIDARHNVVAARQGLVSAYTELEAAGGVGSLISPSLTWVAGTGTGRVWLWGLADGRLLGSFPGDNMIFSSDDHWLVTLEGSSVLSVWELNK
jgi:WD40 repeat protein